MMYKFSLIFFSIFLFYGCAHYTDVVAGRNGVHQVVAVPDEDDEDPDEDELARDALTQATDYCEELFKLKPHILSGKKALVTKGERSVYHVILKFRCH